jgi:predicted transcriptional regulator
MPRIRQYAAKYAMADFGSHIKGRIRNSGLKQADVGKKLGISQQGVSRLLNHPEKITMKQLRDICSMTEVDCLVILKAIGVNYKEDK